MKLLVDIGNTRIKWATLLGEELSPVEAVTYKNQNLVQLLDQIWDPQSVPTEVFVSNVGSNTVELELNTWIKQKWGCLTHFIKSSASAAGVTNGYILPQQLGVDRWLAVIAAHHMFLSDVCVFDCGTAITMDLINAKGLHQGGLIFPGLTLLQNSLINNTANCFITSSEKLVIKNQFVAKNTTDGVMLGGLYAAISIIKNQSLSVLENFNHQCSFVITGGDAPVLIPYLSSAYQYYPSLVLQGLSLLINNSK